MARRPGTEAPARLRLPCCGWWVRIEPRDPRLRVCGSCGHWLMDYGDEQPVLLTQDQIEELPARMPRHAAELVRLTAEIVAAAPCCQRAAGHG